MLSTAHSERLGGVVIKHFFVLGLHWLNGRGEKMPISDWRRCYPDVQCLSSGYTAPRRAGLASS